MAITAVDSGDGTTAIFTKGFECYVREVTAPALTRTAIDTTHMGSASDYRTFIPGLIDPGEITLDIYFDAKQTLPVEDGAAGDLDTLTLTFPDASTWTCSGFTTGYSPAIPMDDAMTCTLTFKVSGKPTLA